MLTNFLKDLSSRLRNLWPQKLGRPTLTDVYIGSEVLGPFLGALGFLTFVFLMFQALRLAEFFIVHEISGLIIIKMIFLLVLSFLPLTIPVAFLVSVLVGFGRLSADSEIVALRASGISVARMAAPIAGIGAILSIFLLLMNLQLVPWGQRAFRQIHVKIGNTKVASAIQAGTFTSGFFDLIIYADKVDPKTNALNKVFIFDDRHEKNPMTVVARTGEILPVRTADDFGSAAMLKLYGGNIHSNDSTNHNYSRIDFEDYLLYLRIDAGADSEAIRKPRMLAYPLLRKQIQKATPRTKWHWELNTELWRRLSTAFAPLIFVFIGIGFGVIRTRSVRSSAALVSFITLLLYWGLLVGSTSLAHSGKVPPFLAMQIPNLLMMGGAYLAFRRVAW